MSAFQNPPNVGLESLEIQTAEQYNGALREAGKLWGAKIGTPDGDRLDALATLIFDVEGK